MSDVLNTKFGPIRVITIDTMKPDEVRVIPPGRMVQMVPIRLPAWELKVTAERVEDGITYRAKLKPNGTFGWVPD